MSNINTLPSATDLRYFQEIAFTQNLSRAAERLGVSQPTLSLSLKRLEEATNAHLFIRRKSGLVLTNPGHQLMKESKSLLNQWELLMKSVRTESESVSGRFVIGCHGSVGTFSLGPILKKIADEFPKIEIILRHDLSRIITEQIISGELDFAVVVNPVPHPELVIKKIADDQVQFWHNPKKVNPEVLIFHPSLLQTQSLLKKIKNKNFKRQFTSESLEVITALTKSGCGVGILPGKVVSAYGEGILEPLKDWPHFNDEICFIYRYDLPRTTGVKKMIELFISSGK